MSQHTIPWQAGDYSQAESRIFRAHQKRYIGKQRARTLRKRGEAVGSDEKGLFWYKRRITPAVQLLDYSLTAHVTGYPLTGHTVMGQQTPLNENSVLAEVAAKRQVQAIVQRISGETQCDN